MARASRALRGGALQHERWRYPSTSMMQAAMVKTAPAATSAVHALMNISSNAATTASSTGSSRRCSLSVLCCRSCEPDAERQEAS